MLLSQIKVEILNPVLLAYLTTMPLYLFRCSLSHDSFRIPNLLSVAQTHGFEFKFVSEDVLRGAVVVELENESHAQKFLDRGMQVM